MTIDVRAYEKSITVDGISIYPLSPEVLRQRLSDVLGVIEKRAKEEGRREAQADMRRSLGLK